MRQIFLICLLLQFVVLVHAQQVTGKVMDTKNNPIPFANVMLLNAKDSSFIAGTVTKNDGSFSLEANGNGNLLKLKVSSIGYETKLIPLNSNNSNNSVDICLDELVKSINEVVVKGSLPQYRAVAGGLNVDIRNSMLKDVGTANDVISLLPGVEGSNGNFTVFAKGKPEIYINNRKVQNANELKYLKSNEIKSIDIITSPGAKYECSTLRGFDWLTRYIQQTDSRSCFSDYTVSVDPLNQVCSLRILNNDLQSGNQCRPRVHNRSA